MPAVGMCLRLSAHTYITTNIIHTKTASCIKSYIVEHNEKNLDVKYPLEELYGFICNSCMGKLTVFWNSVQVLIANGKVT